MPRFSRYTKTKTDTQATRSDTRYTLTSLNPDDKWNKTALDPEAIDAWHEAFLTGTGLDTTGMFSHAGETSKQATTRKLAFMTRAWRYAGDIAKAKKNGTYDTTAVWNHEHVGGITNDGQVRDTLRAMSEGVVAKSYCELTDDRVEQINANLKYYTDNLTGTDKNSGFAIPAMLDPMVRREAMLAVSNYTEAEPSFDWTGRTAKIAAATVTGLALFGTAAYFANKKLDW